MVETYLEEVKVTKNGDYYVELPVPLIAKLDLETYPTFALELKDGVMILTPVRKIV